MDMILDVDDVVRRMALKDITEVRDSIESSLTTAHAVLQGLLHTTFDKAQHTDYFFLDTDLYPEPASGLLRCRLTQAFVWPETIIVLSGETMATTLDPVGSTSMLLDVVRGYVQVPFDLVDHWLKITYTAGFDATHLPPVWLQEAVLAYLPHLLAQPAGSLDAAMMNAATEAQKMAWNVCGKIVEPFLRNRSFMFNAVN